MGSKLSFLIVWPYQADLHKAMPFYYRISYGLKAKSTVLSYSSKSLQIYWLKLVHSLNINIIIQPSTLLALLLKGQLILYYMVGETGYHTNIV